MFKQVMVASLLSISLNSFAGDHSTGSVIAAGIGGLILGNHAAQHRQRVETYPVYTQSVPVYPVPYGSGITVNQYDQTCRTMVPGRYAGNIGATNAWIQGCSKRMEEDQRRFEQEAYQDGAR